MTALELLKDQLDDSGYQLTKVMEGMPEEAFDKKLTPGSMTPREQIGHLCEAYEAFKISAAGGKHEWGSYKPASTETKALIGELESQRGKAVAAVLENPTDETIKHAHDYIVGHDYYHVGQICLARLAVQTDWNPYAIYRG